MTFGNIVAFGREALSSTMPVDIVTLIHKKGCRSMWRTIGYVVGLLMILSGLIWVAQGSGYFPYPSSSFMINQSIWILWGSITAAAGLAVTIIV